jgi:hypothetical protein
MTVVLHKHTEERMVKRGKKYWEYCTGEKGEERREEIQVGPGGNG